MGKSAAPTVLIYTTIALLLLLLLSYTPHHDRPHRRLKLRSTSSSSLPAPPLSRPTIPFDPVIADIEQRFDDREWERARYNFTHLDHHGAASLMDGQHEWEDLTDAEDYINDEDRFNVTGRIVLLFPKLDVAPADGFVSADELTEWNVKQVEREVMHRTKREMELYDKNHDGFVSLEEYEPPSWARRLLDNNSSDSEMGWWQGTHFNASDVDGNGLLNLTEFHDFLHPADSRNPRLIQWLCKEEIRERDKDNDGKLNFQEFFHELFHLIRDYSEVYNSSHQSDTSEEALAKKLFAQLDQDNDGFLSEAELEPVIGNIHPSERYYAKQQAEYTLSQADTDKDDRLSLKEMIENPYVFYSAIFYDEDDYGYHDEFR